ncbi:MAG: DUF5638 domain-containing protein [Legionella sp.]|nr:DUF5638 domain-containing protein [Legionella sp.]
MPACTCTAELPQQIVDCERQLDILFAQIQTNGELEKVKEFFKRPFIKKSSQNIKTAIMNQYNLLIQTLQDVKTGKTDVTKATEIIQEITWSRQKTVIGHNLINLAKILGLVAAFGVSFVSLVSNGLPSILFNPLIGVNVTFALGVLMYQTFEYILKCFKDFELDGRVAKEEKSELNLISFFKPQDSQLLAPTGDRHAPDMPVYHLGS